LHILYACATVIGMSTVNTTKEQNAQAWLTLIIWGLIIIGAFALNPILGLLAILVPLLLALS